MSSSISSTFKNNYCAVQTIDNRHANIVQRRYDENAAALRTNYSFGFYKRL